MTRRQKRTFIRNFMRSMKIWALAGVSTMPAEWDGHELREYLAEAFDRERSNLLRQSRARKRAYNYGKYRVDHKLY